MSHLFEAQQRLIFLREYGSQPLAYSTLQPGLSYFDLPDIGFIAYLKFRGHCYALGDPICSLSQREHLLSEYIKRNPKTCFVQVHRDTASLLHRQYGFRYTAMGIESTIQLDGWNIKGRDKEYLRRARNKADKGLIVITECPAASIDWKAIDEASARWLATRRVERRELRFLSRPMLPEPDASIRHFLAYREGQLLAYIFFDPVFSGGNIVGYYPSVARLSEGFKPGLYYALILQAIEQFRVSGVKRLYLGLSPLAKLGKPECSGNSDLARLLLRGIYAYGGRFYNFKGIEFAKERFCGETEPVFFTHRNILPVGHLFAVLKLCNVI